jgi:two-component system, OmpR family, phosphate regulon sensor histidine kinase PhoR
MKKYFPWLYFWKLTGSIFSVIAAFLVFILFVGLHQTEEIFNDPSFVFLFVVLIVSSFLVATLIAYRFSLPMKKIVLKAMRLANKRLFFEFSEKDSFKDSVFESESKEFFELEQYLDQIKKKLKVRREQIAHGYEESKTLMSAIEEAVVNVDKNGRALFFNSAFASKFVSRATLTGNPLLSQIFRDGEILDLFDKAIHEGKSGKIQKSLVTQMDSRERIFSLSVSPLKDQKSNEVFEVMGIFHDISELKWAEKIRSEFVENASHELRTPLTSIIGYLEIIKEDAQNGNSENTLENVLIVNKSVDRLNALVHDLLSLSRMENGERPLIEKNNPELVTEEVIKKLSPFAKQKNVQLSFQNHGVELVNADATKLEQVLSNLIENGIKYNRNHGQVEIHWYPTDNGCKLVVKDDGPGIAKNHQERLFERFYRVDRARSRDIGGSGLGLAIVKHIMNIHGGTVAVKSDVGLGTEFICLFP